MPKRNSHDEIARYCSGYDLPEEFDSVHNLNSYYTEPIDSGPAYRAHPLFKLMQNHATD